MKLENIMLREISQIKKTHTCILSHMQNLDLKKNKQNDMCGKWEDFWGKGTSRKGRMRG
jgi:hypothetical protein